jgi:hypothetical protein
MHPAVEAPLIRDVVGLDVGDGVLDVSGAPPDYYDAGLEVADEGAGAELIVLEDF